MDDGSKPRLRDIVERIGVSNKLVGIIISNTTFRNPSVHFPERLLRLSPPAFPFVPDQETGHLLLASWCEIHARRPSSHWPIAAGPLYLAPLLLAVVVLVIAIANALFPPGL